MGIFCKSRERFLVKSANRGYFDSFAGRLKVHRLYPYSYITEYL